ncbi:MAG: hypothetical protein ACI8RZ_002926 [Myxococcota bacterium]|jgi:hypothetical protein
MPTLFDASLAELSRLKGAEYSFLKQLSAPKGEPTRAWLEGIGTTVGVPVARRASDLLNSLDNRRFFQGFSELSVSDVLLSSGWSVPDLSWPGPMLSARSPDGVLHNIIVLAFIRQVRLGPDRQTVERLIRSLNRVSSRTRIAVHIQRWLPHDLDPEPIRRAVELWLRDVDRHGSQDRYAVYSDANVSLEFALTAERARSGQSVVAFTIAPCTGQRTMELIESRVLTALDAYRLGPLSRQPVLLACVTEQPWQLSRGWIRQLLYGKPGWAGTMGTPPAFEAAFDEKSDPGIFRDPLYRAISGALLIDRALDSTVPTARAYLNPWSETSLPAEALNIRRMAPDRRERDHTVLRWLDATV